MWLRRWSRIYGLFNHLLGVTSPHRRLFDRALLEHHLLGVAWLLVLHNPFSQRTTSGRQAIMHWRQHELEPDWRQPILLYQASRDFLLPQLLYQPQLLSPTPTA